MRTRKSRRAGGTPALIERMEERCLLSAAFANGTANATAYDASGRLWVAYYDTAANNLKYSLRNADGTWAVSGQLLDAGVPGPNGEPANVAQESVSMVIERGGFPGVAYTDVTNADLRYAHFNGTSWDVETIEDRYTTGQYPSIAFNPANNRPAISYYYGKAGDLRLRQFNGTDWGGAAGFQLIDGQPTDDVGRYSILALDRAGWWAVGYDDTTNGAAKYAYQRSGGVWTTRTVDAAPQSDVAFTSIAFDSSNRPALAYYDATNADLKFARGADSAGTSWGVNTPSANNTVGKYTSMFYNSAADKFTIYYNYEAGGTTRIKYLTGNLNAWPGTAQTLYTGGGSESRIAYTPGVAGGITYTWSGADATGAPTLFVNDTTTGTVWRQETADAGFGSRLRDAGSVVHTYNGQQKIYVIGGNQPDAGGDYYGNTNTVRASADGGATWSSWAPQAVGGGAAFSPRLGLTTVSFLGKLWVIGGGQPTGPTRDAWSSADGGVTWTREADLPATFAPREYMSSAVSEDGATLYLIGGQTASGYPAEVWATTDGATWAQRTATAPFGGRYKASAVSYKGRLWYMAGAVNGGIDDNSVWWSADGGVTWAEAIAADSTARFGVRFGQQAVVNDGRMWVLGGQYTNPSSGLNSTRDDAWYSFDGLNWTKAAQTSALGSRYAFNAVSFGGRLVAMFGETYPYNGKNDVWSAT